MNKYFEILKRETVYDGFLKIAKLSLRHTLFAGGWSAVITRELMYRGNAAAILLYDPVREIVVMIEQFRVGALNLPEGPWLTELVAGIVEAGEEPVDVVRREAVEEAGVEPVNIKHISSYLLSSGGCDEQTHLYYGEIDSSLAEGIHGLESEGEDIRVLKMSRQEAFAALDRGTLSNATTIIGLQWLRQQTAAEQNL